MSLPVADLAFRFHELFTCNTEVYGQTTLTGKTRERDGKTDSKSFLVKSELNTDIWEQHLRGEKIIGCTPLINEENVKWGALDIDVYQNANTIENILDSIVEHKLPFILCRSKSGGAHVYIFFSEEISAVAVIDKLKSFSAFFGQGACEIYPKQPKIGNRKDNSKYGNWINMPYSGTPTLQYAFNWDKEALNPEQFIEFAVSKKLNKASFNDLKVPALDEEALPDGPPCLNYIFKHNAKHSESRNITLANVAVYLKKAYPSEWKLMLSKFNRKFSEPLEDREVENIIKSYEKKDYKYQCANNPLCKYCDAKLCGQRKYGIGQEEFLPNNRSLIQLKSDPPLWFLTLDDAEIQLTTEQFDNFNQFNQRVMERLLFKFPPIKQEDWIKQQNLLLKNCTQIEIPFEMTPIGQLVEYVSMFCATASDNANNIKLGPIKQHGCFYFRMVDLKDYLGQQRFKELPDNKILSVIKQVLKADAVTHTIKEPVKLNVRCWRVRSEVLEISPSHSLPNLEDENPY
tara:strand:+ start:7576 stop:9120 length:1545 start_codon:yes stop_codon:yes gene_type:complete